MNFMETTLAGLEILELPKEPMDFEKVLVEGCFSLNLKSDTKDGIISEMIDLQVAAGKIRDRQAALDAVMDREKRMSTGMQHGVAFPHGKTATLETIVTAFALKKRGIDFDALDGQPCRIFIMTVSPLVQAGPHMEYLAEMGRLLDVPTTRERVLEASSKEDIISALLE